MRDDERRTLTEIEDHLRMADPAFVARMSDDTRRFPTVAVLAVCWFLTAPLVSMLFGPAVFTVTTVAVLAVVTAVMIRRRRERLRLAHSRRRR